MSRLPKHHPSAEQLLQYTDGELSQRRAGEVQAHLAACWECRTEVEEIQQTIGDLVRYRKTVLQDCLPSPPAPWCDLYQRFERYDSAPGSRSFIRTSINGLRRLFLRPWRWAPAPIAVALILAIFYQFTWAPSARAAELLHKATVASQSRPAKPKRLALRTRSARLTRPVANRSDALALASLEKMFLAARYDWNDPLSAKSFAAWRSQLPEKRDEVNTTGELYQIRTKTNSNEIVEATLTLRARDLEPVESTLEFRNQERVEITELPAIPVEESTVPPVVASPAAPTPAPARPAPAAVAPAGPAEELAVFAALNRLGADLGEPVEITRTEGRIYVGGPGVAESRRREIERELSGMPNVVIDFEAPATSAVTPAPKAVAPAAPAVSTLQARLEQELGGRASFDQTADQVLEWTEAMMARAHALRRLSERFDNQDGLTPAHRDVLREMKRQHAAVLLHNASAIEQRLRPVLEALGGSAGPADRGPATIDRLFRAARQAETLVGVLLGGAGADAAPETLPSRLLSALVELRSEAALYERTTKAAQ